MSQLAKILNIEQLLEIVFIKVSIIGNGNKLMGMIGMFYGAKNNKSIGFFRNIVCNLAPESITLEGILSFVERTCLAKTSKNTSESSKNKVNNKLIRKFCVIK